MIFDGRTLDEIGDEEIAELVETHISELQHIEFKATFEYKEDDARVEMLKDVVAMANGGGGYIFIGIGDDGPLCVNVGETIAPPEIREGGEARNW